MIEMGVGVGGRVYQLRPKDVLWGSSPATLGSLQYINYVLSYENPWLPLMHGASYCLAET